MNKPYEYLTTTIGVSKIWRERKLYNNKGKNMFSKTVCVFNNAVSSKHVFCLRCLLLLFVIIFYLL